MSMTETADEVTADDHGISVRLTNGEGFAWGDNIEGVVTIDALPTKTRTYSVVSVSIVEQDTEGFISPVGFAGTRDPLNPMGSAVLGAEYNALATAPLENNFGETVIARDITVAHGVAPREISFALPVSEDIRLTTLCYVAARAVAKDDADTDRHAAVGFVLLPPRAVQAVQNALKTFGDFQSVEVSNQTDAHGASHFTLDYIAPESLQDRLDGIKFVLTVDDKKVGGYAEINPQEKSIADHLRSFVHADRIRLPLDFERAELDAAGADGTPAPSATQRLNELLDPFLNPVG